jgi:hypothetical protein
MSGESVRPPTPLPPEVSVVIIAGDDRTPIAAEIVVDEEPIGAGDDGSMSFPWLGDPVRVTASAPGFVPRVQVVNELPEEKQIELVLAPVVLRGTVTTNDGRPLPFSVVELGGDESVTDAAGRFELTRAVPGEISLTRPAWEPASYDWTGETLDIELAMEPRMVRALRVGGDIAGSPGAWRRILELADDTVINALVVDTKEEGGTVFHDTEVETAHEIGAVQAFYDLDRVIQDMKDHGLYKITRIVVFQDNPLARARPEIAVRDRTTGETWRNNKGLRWLDATDRESWNYALDLAEEACRRGFDEIQFDYVRFPSDGDVSVMEFDELSYTGSYYSEESQQLRVDAIRAFLQAAHDLLNPMGCAVAADIFAITLESSTDEGIGQRPGPLSQTIDVLSPMIYTYTYGSGWKGLDNPNEHAVKVVGEALDAGIPRLEGFSIYRPWIQTWPLDAAEMQAVQDVAEERDLGWMTWSANTIYDPVMFDPASAGE